MAYVFGDTREEVARRKFLDRAWQSFVGDGVEIDGLPSEIVRSWRRARDTFGVDPGQRRISRLLTPSDLAHRRDRDETYRISLPILEEFGARLAGTEHVLAFFDPAGWMLSIGGNRYTAEQLAEINFCPGANWREESAGTNGPGTALTERRPLEVFASEHFVAAWQAWNCSAAPIHAPGTGELLGVVDITGPWQAHDVQALVTTRAIARAVEERLRSVQAVRDGIVGYAFRAAAGSGAGLLAVNARGQLLAANDAARTRLAVEGMDLPVWMRDLVQAALGQRAGGADPELLVDFPGGGKGKLVASPVTYEQQVVGALMRLAPVAPPRARAPSRCAPGARYDFDQIQGASDAIAQATAQARMATRNDLPVVLFGESGTGKELFAQAIHSGSERAGGPFVAVNCGCIPAALLEAELFGYEPGAFTGGRKEGNAGKFEEADGGTIFLDEVSELSPQAQTALLRVLQEREVVRLGASAPRRVDIRVLAATNKSLLEEIRAGRFRSDLYFRLNVLAICVPSLRTRCADIGLLARAFLREAEAQTSRTGLALSDDALCALERYEWPGNVRELRNVMLRVAATARGPLIEAADLPEEVRPAGVVLPARLGAPGPSPAAPDHPDRDALVRALEASEWNVARTAHALHVSRNTLYRWLHKHGIERQL